MKTGLAALGAALVLGLGAGMAQASEDMRVIRVTGEGRVAAAPDTATITMGVTEQADAAHAAMSQVSVSVAAILERLEEIGIAPEDVQTQRLTVNPVWSNRNYSEGEAEITGFVANNAISVRIRDLPSLGDVLDRILEEGGNDFSGLQFSVQDPEPLVNEARRAAVADARAKAELYAEAAGVSLGAVQRIEEMGGSPRPMMMEMAAASRGSSVPIAEGEVTVEASVNMVFLIAE
ncbi:membrane protein [Marinibacterium profundimaris]|uniref:Membrane protein n=1 Tax=Marinibacterium profundimaris TaxID=1679460 RepID=A0A225NHQ2_9RHOB|nr:membrane protein [Marinibacterium profundimaris]